MKFNEITHYQPFHCLPANRMSDLNNVLAALVITFFQYIWLIRKENTRKNWEIKFFIRHHPSVQCRISKHDIIKVLVKIDNHDFLFDLDFKITKNGSISFSSSMTFMVPLSWRYVRVIVFGHIYLNNTVNIRISILDPTTWQDGKDILIMCPIATDSTPKGVRFFSQ